MILPAICNSLIVQSRCYRFIKRAGIAGSTAERVRYVNTILKEICNEDYCVKWKPKR